MYDVSQEFLQNYNKVYDTLFKNYSSVSEKIKIEDLNKDLNAIAYNAFREFFDVDAEIERRLTEQNSEGSSESAMELDDEIMKEYADSDIMKVFKFLTLTGLSAYFGLSNIDLNISSDHEFGYNNAFSNIESLLTVINIDSSNFNQDTYNKLLSISRSCDVKTYFDNEYYIEDIKFVQKLLTSTKIVSKDSEEDRIAIVEAFGETMSNEVRLIVDTFKEIIAANFGIDPYVGVFTFDKTFPVIGLSSNGGIRHIEPSRQFCDIYAVELAKFFKVHLPSNGIIRNEINEKFSDRQYNYEAILAGYNNDNTKPVYFPYKFLEIVTKSMFTSRVQSLAYGNCKNGESSNLNNYCSYLISCFEEDIYNYCSVICHKSQFTYKNDTKRDIPDSKLTLTSILLDLDNPIRSEFCSDICNKLHYYRHCVTTGVVLTSLDTQKIKKFGVSKVEILQYRLKVCYSKTMLSNLEFNSGLSKRIYNNASKMSDSEMNVSINVDDMYIMDYSYTFDADKVYARPVFAYKALNALKAQSMTLDWTNMLLGRYADGSLCRSASGEKIFLQNKQLHNIYAGSRSGKGVMCFNIFATAIASQIPIFYLDRKPDTAVILKSLAPNMFAVNGGQYDSTIDLQNVFEPSSINYKIPSYMEEYFMDTEVKNDFIYFRAILLLYSLVIFMDKVKNTEDSRYVSIAKKLQKGAIFVFDEFTNFTNKFLAKYPTTTGWFRGTNCYSSEGLKKWTAMISTIKSAKIDLNSKQSSEKRNEAQIAKAEDKLSSAIDDTDTFKLSAVYMSQLADCYRDICEGIPELYRAGGALVKSVQTFIIGQDIPSEYYESGTFFKSSNGTNPAKFNTSNHKAGNTNAVIDVPLIRMINNMGGDYILGYQPSDKGGIPTYLAQRNPNVISSSMLTQARRCFCYYDPGTILDYNALESIKNTEKFFNGNVNAMQNFLNENFTFFKPFLILNNAVVPPTELLQPDLPNLGVSEELENKRAAKGNFSMYKESQYVGQCLTQCNKAGLTWEEILADNQDSSGEFNSAIGFEGYIKQLCDSVPVDSMESSGDIMNIFVRDVFGYTDGNWLDFLADFRPEAMFKPKDFINAIDDPDNATVQARLANSFFNTALLKNAEDINFATIFQKELGSLYQYYNGTSNSDDSSLSDFKDFDEDSESIDFDDSTQVVLDDSSELDDIESVQSPTNSESADIFNQDERINQRYGNPMQNSMENVMEGSMRQSLEAQARQALNNIFIKHPDWKVFWTDELCEMLIQNTVSAYLAQGGM